MLEEFSFGFPILSYLIFLPLAGAAVLWLIEDEDLLKIRQVTRLSERLILEYQGLYETFSRKSSPRLKELISRSSLDLKKMRQGVVE